MEGLGSIGGGLLSAMDIAIVAVGASAVAFQTWLSFFVTSRPPTSTLQRRLFEVAFVLAGTIGISSAIYGAVQNKAEYEGLKGAVNEKCMSQIQVHRLLVLNQLRNEYNQLPGRPPTDPVRAGVAWPPQDWMNKRLGELGATWRVRITGENIEFIQLGDVRSER